MLLSRLHPKTTDELNRLFDGLFHPATFLPLVATRNGTAFPRLDVSETDSAIHVTAELPGVKSEDMELEIHADTLRLSGEKKDERVVNEHNFRSVERSFGRFDRTIVLPSEVDSQNAEATFKDGVLTVHLPKVKAATVQKIAIKPAP